MRLIVARHHQHDDAIVVAAIVVGQDIARAARVDHVAGAEQQQRIERLRAHRGLELGEPLAMHSRPVELARRDAVRSLSEPA